MTVHDLAPGFILMFYNTPYSTHKMIIPVKNPTYDAGSTTWFITNKTGSASSWATQLTSYVTALKANMSTLCTFDYAELYSKAVGAIPVFLATASLNIVGTAAGAAIQASQCLWSWRDDAGGKGKVYLLDQSNAVNGKGGPPTWINAGIAGVSAYLVSAGSIVYSRNNAFPANVPHVFTKTNDALRKKYNMV